MRWRRAQRPKPLPERAQDESWRPSITVSQVLSGIQQLMSEPNELSPAQVRAAPAQPMPTAGGHRSTSARLRAALNVHARAPARAGVLRACRQAPTYVTPMRERACLEAGAYMFCANEQARVCAGGRVHVLH